MQINRKFLAFCRTIHIYLTMLALFVMLLFGITGFTVNHEDLFDATTPRISETNGQTPKDLITKNDRLMIVEHLRSTFRIRGALTSFDELEQSLSLGFKEPGQVWEIEISKADGKTAIHSEAFNFIAMINNLHRGRYAGESWRWVIDISAILILIACITGVVLWMALPKRRKIGIAAMLLGTLATLAIYAWLVPGPDQHGEQPHDANALALPQSS
jgi:hypothetical protein